jgi:hypothetical protein
VRTTAAPRTPCRRPVRGRSVRAVVAVRDAHAARGDNRCRITFQLTFLGRNVHELADIVRLAIDLVARVEGNHLWAAFTEIASTSR